MDCTPRINRHIEQRRLQNLSDASPSTRLPSLPLAVGPAVALRYRAMDSAGIFARTREGLASMSRVSVADRSRLSWLTLRRSLDHVAGRLRAHPMGRLPFITGRSERLVIAPQDLRTADPTRASEIYSGRFAFAGKIVVCDGRSPFEMDPPSDEWADMLLGFGWLRHLRAADSGITRAHARALVAEWIALQGSWNSLAWRPEIVTRRIISWLSQAPLVLQESEAAFYRRFIRNLTRQVRYLRRTL